ncbi:MAG: nicotinate (nicotinamide) nucleotide adenylyltransferase [Ferruginibacter sp.]|nr:nicotinate (nicotinamide) nucleotide adenylyltransferase [Ferruginibacter sp.]
MKIGLYFGSFNPVHVGHLIIANHVLNEGGVNQVWLVISPQNPLKASAGLLNEYHRLHLVQTAIEGENHLKASNVEFSLPKPSYTANTLAYLTEKYPQHEFVVIMGSDSFSNLSNWKNYQYILDNHEVFVYPRPGFEVSNDLKANLSILNAPLLEISSSSIRKLIKDKKSIRYLVTDLVKEEIEKYSYYR